MHSKQKGNIGEAAVSLDIIKRGYPVFKEAGDLSKVDLVTIIDNRCFKIQVKNLGYTNSAGAIPFTIHKSGPNYSFTYTENDIDIYAALLPNDKIVYITWSDLKGRDTMTLRLSATKNKQTANVNNYEDFLDFDRAVKVIIGTKV